MPHILSHGTALPRGQLQGSFCTNINANTAPQPTPACPMNESAYPYISMDQPLSVCFALLHTSHACHESMLGMPTNVATTRPCHCAPPMQLALLQLAAATRHPPPATHTHNNTVHAITNTNTSHNHPIPHSTHLTPHARPHTQFTTHHNLLPATTTHSPHHAQLTQAR